MKTVLTVLTLFIVQLVLAQDILLRQTIKGTIIDEQSGNALGNVSVILVGPGLSGEMTDSLGNFKLKNVPIGRQTIRISLVGYEEAIMRNIEVTSRRKL